MVTPEVEALKNELEEFVEKMRANKKYRYTPQDIKEFTKIKSRYPSATWDELQENLSHKSRSEYARNTRHLQGN